MHSARLSIIGAPLDLGQDRRGVDMGPSALRVANLKKRLASIGYDVEDLGNVPVEQPESLPEGPERAKYLPQIAATCRKLALKVENSLDNDRAPVVLGGDHSIAIGTVAGVSHYFGKQQQKV